MPISLRRLSHLTTAGLASLTVLFALSGCSSVMPRTVDGSASGAEPTSAAPETPEAPEAPWGDDDTPTVVIEFEQDGASHTLASEIPFGLLSCNENGLVAIGSKSPDPGIGVLFTFEPDVPVVASAWIVSDRYVAQVALKTVVSATPIAGGGTIYSVVGATGDASVAPRDIDKIQIGDYVFGPSNQVDATASFTVTCPAE